MGEFHMQPLCYDEIAKHQGEDIAQEMWQKNGGAGRYVPGMVAVKGITVNSSHEGFLGEGVNEHATRRAENPNYVADAIREGCGDMSVSAASVQFNQRHQLGE